VGRDHYAVVEGIASQLTQVRQIIAIHGAHAHWPSYAEWRDSQSQSDPDITLSLDDDIVQLYTSGTTGHPKGVCHSHRTWGAAAFSVSISNPSTFAPDCVNLVCLPLFHVAGMNPLCFVLAGGGRVVLTRRTDPVEIMALLDTSAITNCLLVPALILAILNLPHAATIGSLRSLSYGASPIAEDVLRRAREVFNCPFEHLYGMTENWGVATALPATMHDAALGKLKSCGKPQAGCEVKIVDEAGRECAVGDVGEVIMRSAWIMRGYWKRVDATAKAIRDGWLWTGDAGFIDADGYLYIHDRVNDMIKPGSENVYPAEVENVLFGHPAIADVAVIGVPDARWGEAVKAIVVLKPGAELDIADIERHARERIAGYKIPRSYEVVSALPRNASGKVLRRQLREEYGKR
jgi:fatty-acyl-CoA synthase